MCKPLQNISKHNETFRNSADLDISVDDASPSAGYYCLHHLSEEVPGKLLLKNALLGDEVEKVFARLGTLHHDDEAVVPFEVVKEADHTFS